AHAALVEGGTLAIFSFRPEWSESPLTAAIDEAYARVAPGLSSRLPGARTPTQESKWRACGREPAPSTRFSPVGPVRTPRPGELAPRAFLDLLRTQSNHRLLDPDVLEELLDEVGRVIDDAGGSIPIDSNAELVMARRRG